MTDSIETFDKEMPFDLFSNLFVYQQQNCLNYNIRLKKNIDLFRKEVGQASRLS